MQYPPNDRSEQYYQPQQPTYYPQQQPPPPPYTQPLYYQYPPPMMPPPQPRRKRSNVGLWIGLVLAFLFVAGAVNAVKDNVSGSTVVATATALTTTDAQQQVATNPVDTPAPVSHNYRVGDVVRVDGTWQVQFTKVTLDYQGDGYTNLKAGDVFLVIHTITKNISSQSQLLSSGANYTFRDTTGNNFDEQILAGKYQPPDGTVVAGEQLQGDLVYEVPVATKHYNLYFQSNSFSGTPSEWDINI